MSQNYARMEGCVVRVRDRSVSVEASVPAAEQITSSSTRFFNEVQIELASGAVLSLLLRWPDRLFVQNGDHLMAWTTPEHGLHQVWALCNLSDGSRYLLLGSPLKRRRLKRLADAQLPSAAKVPWLSA